MGTAITVEESVTSRFSTVVRSQVPRGTEIQSLYPPEIWGSATGSDTVRFLDVRTACEYEVASIYAIRLKIRIEIHRLCPCLLVTCTPDRVRSGRGRGLGNLYSTPQFCSSSSSRL
jgi:hypothetical protein